MLALYHNDMSSCAQKVRLCLAEKELDWESRHLNLRADEHQQEWYLKLNPRAVVPTLVDGETVVPESNVINEYLEDRFPYGSAACRKLLACGFAVHDRRCSVDALCRSARSP
jgi:glutathione S-transferase